MRNLLDPKNRSYFGLEFAFQRIPNELVLFDHDAFEAWPGQVEAVVTNVETGKPEYKDVGRRDMVNTLMMASCAMPLLFPIFEIDGKQYLDGGASDAIPYGRAFGQGCDRVMVILTKPRDFIRKPEGLMPLIRRAYKKYPAFCETMERRAERYNACREQLFELERQGKVLVIAPESTLGVSRIERDTEKLELLWGQGYRMAADRMDEIRAFLR